MGDRKSEEVDETLKDVVSVNMHVRDWPRGACRGTASASPKSIGDGNAAARRRPAEVAVPAASRVAVGASDADDVDAQSDAALFRPTPPVLRPDADAAVEKRKKMADVTVTIHVDGDAAALTATPPRPSQPPPQPQLQQQHQQQQQTDAVEAPTSTRFHQSRRTEKGARPRVSFPSNRPLKSKFLSVSSPETAGYPPNRVFLILARVSSAFDTLLLGFYLVSVGGSVFNTSIFWLPVNR